MANELTLSFSATLANGKLNDSIPRTAYLVTQTNPGVSQQVFDVTTAEMDLVPTGITTPGHAFIQNLDPTNYLIFGPKSGGSMVPLCKLKPGEFAWGRWDPGIVLRAAANTATCKALLKVYED